MSRLLRCMYIYIYMLTCVWNSSCLFFNFFNNKKKLSARVCYPHCVRKKFEKGKRLDFDSVLVSPILLLCKKVIFSLRIYYSSSAVVIIYLLFRKKTQIKNEKTISFKLI